MINLASVITTAAKNTGYVWKEGGFTTVLIFILAVLLFAIFVILILNAYKFPL